MACVHASLEAPKSSNRTCAQWLERNEMKRKKWTCEPKFYLTHRLPENFPRWILFPSLSVQVQWSRSHAWWARYFVRGGTLTIVILFFFKPIILCVSYAQNYEMIYEHVIKKAWFVPSHFMPWKYVVNCLFEDDDFMRMTLFKKRWFYNFDEHLAI